MYMRLVIKGRQKYISAELLVPEPFIFEVEMVIEKLLRALIKSQQN
jgi:hypothetical protein